MKKQLKTIALATVFGLFAFASAKAADGDIYDIVPCDELGLDLSPVGSTWSTFDAPLGSGETVYFKVRLVARDVSATPAKCWYLDYDGIISEEVAKYLYPMRIGIYVSGRRTYADLVTARAEGNFTTELVFKYTTQPGDFAMPIRLATDDGPAGDSTSNGEYVFDPLSSYWKMSRLDADDNVVSDCSWVFTSNDGRLARARTDIGRAPVSDYSLEKCGFFVKTVDFDSNWEVPAGSADEAWRTIHDGSTATGNAISPRLVISAPSEQSRTFYVWSDDETKVRIKATAAVPVTTVTMMVDGAPKDFSVGKVTFEGGQSAPAPFLVEALAGSEGGSANLILSAYSNFTYSASTPGMLLVDYITVPVRCIAPLPASIVAECGDTTITADSDYLTSKTTLSIFLSQPGAADVHVTLKTSFEEDPAKTDWGDYVRFSQSEVTVQTLPEADEITFTIPAGSTEPKTIYVYALRSDAHTTGTGHQIKFTPFISDAEKTAAGIVGETAAGVWITAAKPVITNPDATSVYEVTSGEELEINVAVEDTYADMTDTTTGYQVRIKTGSTASWQTLTERFKASGEGGELVGITSGNAPMVKYSAAGPQTSQIQVISPISGKKSEIVSFTVNVTPAKTTSAICRDADPDHYIEGDAVHFRIALSSQNDTEAPIYAFLLCNGDMDASMFGGTDAKAILTDATAAAPGSVGLTISEVGSFVNGSFTVLDGLSADDAGQNYTFSVVLSKTKEYTGTRMPGYATTEMLNITVYNKEPTFKTVSLNGFDAESDGYTFSNQYPKGQDQTIQPVFDDVSYDLKHGFTYKWTAYRDGQAVVNGTVAHDTTGTVTETTTTTNARKDVFTTVVPDGANINECPIVYNFPRAGTWMIKIQMKDKDMTSFSASTYSISFVVLANPQITITPLDSYDETDGKASIDVGLGYFDSDEDIVVKLTVTPPEGTNPGALVLDPALKAVPAGYPALAANEYYLSFDSAQTIPVSIDSMDGTQRSASKGFTVKAEVVSDGPSSDPSMTWAEYYTPHETKIYVNNIAPEFGYVTPANTNAWEVSGGAATSYPIAWSIRSDVDYDFTTPWANGDGPGIKVTFQGCDNATSFYVKDTDEWSGTFIPNFGTMQGDQNVVLTIEDKDQGIETWTYMYRVKPSKFLRTLASGPSSGVGTMLSRKYAQAKGRGAGHVWADCGESPNGNLFNFLWNCGSRTSVEVYGMGYKVGDVDDGSLQPYDFKISTSGAPANGAPYYTYADAKYDSFLYGWLNHAFGEGGGLTSSIIGDSALPEIAGTRPAATPVGLPESATEGGPYPETYVEAVFSKEWREFDNCGDINQDGVPDRALIDYDFGVAFDGVGDLGDLSGFNGDNDFLPGLSTGGNGIVPNVVGAWQAQGIAFNAFLEIRGFGSGLNAGYPNGDGTDPEPDYSANEKRAWLEWKGVNTQEELAGMSEEDVNAAFAANVADAKADLAAANAGTGGWSPERPTNPTEEDTDKDGLADGYEYWFWYGAKVGYSKDGKWVGRMKGRRLNLDHLDIFDEIASDDVCLAFDPLVSAVAGDNDATRGSIASRDFDNDGLYDIEEYLIGTNPVDCDTDNGGVPDGFEIMWGFNPLDGSDENDSAKNNPDGDFMAYADMSDYLIVEFDADLGEGAEHYVYIAKEYDETAGVLTGSLLGTGDYADLVWKIGPDTVPKSKSIGASETVDLVAIGADSITATPVDGLSLVHNQVYNFFGFDPRTGWSIGCTHGYVAPRWCPDCNTQDDNVAKVGAAGLAVNTRAYTFKDEFYFGKYNGLDMKNTVLATLRASCTNPNVPFPDATYGDSATQYASTVHGADSDANGAPDGWEAYVGFNPVKEPESDIVGSSYRSNDGARCYGGCETVSNNTSTASGWYNKFFPTDPYTEDTDGDGIGDDAEGRVWKGAFYAGRLTWPNVDFTFIYGSPEDDGFAICIRGGGMNPCSTDTDLDGIPDAWEHQHPGIVVTPEGAVVNTDDDAYTAALRICDGFGTDDFSPVGNFITGGMDATDGTDACTNPRVQDKHVGTIRDRDFDHDGLENFQEYLVQSVRCWRYDDVDTPLMGRAIKWPEGGGEPSYVSADDSYLVFDVYDGAAMLDQVKASPLWAELGAGSTLSSLDKFDYASLGYFAQCDHEWDAAYQFGFKYMKRPQTKYYDAMTGAAEVLSAFDYVSTDPRKWDSDADGMDDFWEIFHGLNPILGGTDLIAGSYIGIASDMNMWTETSGVSGYDPVALPWLMGVTDADPDGDGIRNLDEAISGNLTSPTTYHTDPTPLWMTEPTTPASYVSQYYPTSLGLMLSSPWTWGVNVNGAGEASTAQYMFSFDITEGFDTDGDWVGDGHEVIRSATAISDPLDSGDPDRRAALYLPGADACAYSVSEGNVPVFDTYDLFRQFTVEAWIKPDVVDRKQTIVERGFAYPASNLVNAEPAWRANFRLEIGEDGVLRGVFDNDNAVQSGAATLSTQTIVGGKIKPEVWTHVAMTFDGINVTMYIDGRSTTIATSRLIPANGIISILQEPGGTNSYPFAEYATVPGANTVGARRSEVNFGWNGGFEQFTDFFKGYIAEVRFWDGARTASEIAETYKTRMTPGLAAEHREAVYAKWKGTDTESGATRNDMDGNPMLPAQLITVYNFQQLPAALSDADAAQTPSGFTHGVQDNTTLTAEETKVGWWDASPLKSTVYKDTRVVPYAQNVVSHLAPLDGSCDDSMYWANAWAGYVPAVDNGVKSYAFPNGGNPYKGRSYMMERSFRIWRWFHLSEGREASADEAEDLANRSTFQARSEFTGLDDLVPLGGAFAKLDAEYWDGQGASTAWSQTGTDADGDGLPDWWEDIWGLDKNDAEDWAKMVAYKGTDIPAWEAYLRDIAKGMQPDGSVDDAYKSTADADANGLLDWWQNIYALATGASGDDDGDGLSNYVEYMLSEVFGLKGTDGNWLRFAPDNAYSVNLSVPDYFYRMNQLYVGEIFTDHDRIKDLWESEYLVKNNAVTPYLYDADVDADGDGWSNYAEFQSGSRPTVLASRGIDGVQIEEYPIPTIEMTIAYHGNQGISDIPIVVKAWSDPSLATKPDAIWTLGGAGDVSVTQNGGSNVVTGVRYIGMNPQREMLMHLSPGSVVPGSVSFEFKDLAWVLVNTLTQQGYVFDAATAIWEGALIDSQHTGETTGDIIDQGTKDVLGTIDYITGAVTIDFTKLRERLYIDGDISGSSGEGDWVSIYDLSSSYVRVNWQSKLIAGGTTATYYLGKADEPSSANNSLGHVKQGLNTFIAFYDLNADGMYTPGEPYGHASNVDVGWNYAKASIELTDTSVISPRYNLTLGGTGGEGGSVGSGGETASEPTDREALWEASANDVSVLTNGIAAPAKDYVHVRIVRIGVDKPTLRFPAAYTAVLYDRVLDLTADGHQILTEADLLSDARNAFDLDWDANADGSGQKTLAETLTKFGSSYAFTNVYYGVYIGNAGVNAQSTNETMLLSRLVSRKFSNTRYLPVPVQIPNTLTSPAPTFTWMDSPQDSTYTAFRIRIKNGTKVVWTSGYQLMPPRNEKKVYSWTPPIRVGAIMPGGTATFENNTHYSWEISTYNARFKTDSWTTGGTFYTAVPSSGSDYGTANVAVRYYGPSSVAAGKVRVQAFKTPDFSGEPVAEGYVSDKADIASTSAIKTANAKILGLKAGSYYIRAFVDTDQNGRLSFWTDQADRRSTWESWGCYCTRDTRTGTIFTPKSVTVGPGSGVGDIIPVFIEDCDTDQDTLPDAWEWTQNSNLTAYGAAQIDQNAGGFAMRKALTQALTAEGSYSSGLAVMTTTNLQSPRVAALLLGVSATGSDSQVQNTLNAAGSDVSVDPVSVEITSIELDREAGTVKITADTEGKQSGAAAVTSEIYTIPSGAESLDLTCSVLHCDELGGSWKTIATKKVKIDRTTTNYEFDLGGDVDLSSGFFKVKLEK